MDDNNKSALIQTNKLYRFFLINGFKFEGILINYDDYWFEILEHKTKRTYLNRSNINSIEVLEVERWTQTKETDILKR